MELALVEKTRTQSIGKFITVDGIRLHYIDQGRGTPVILLHGNGSMIGDFVSSGITERLGPGYRVLVFDRPGFGYSERPRGRKWGPFEQAKLLLRAFDILGIEQPVIVGHSWGTLVALALALETGCKVAGLVLLSGYYYPMPRASASAAPRSPFPIIDDVVWQTVMPFVWRLRAHGAVSRIFAPCPVPDRFKRMYSIPDALRPSQMKAVQEEAAMLGEAVRSFSALYKEVSVPVRLLAGSDDRIVDTKKHSARLHLELGGSTFRVVQGCGHMVHHTAPDEVTSAIHGMRKVRSRTVGATVRRHWLEIGERPIDVGRVQATVH